MGRNTAAMKRGWNYDYTNTRLAAMVDGFEAFRIDSTGANGYLQMTTTETQSDPGRQIYLQRTHTGALGDGKGLTGIEVRSTFNGSEAASSSEVKGGEFKARHTTGNAYTIGTMRGCIGNVDAKNGTVTLGRAGDFVIEGAAGSTITTAIGVYGKVQTSGTITNGYAGYFEGHSAVYVKYGVYVRYATNAMLAESVTNGIYVTCPILASADGKLAKLSGTVATPAMSAGYGAFEVELSVGGAGTGNTAVASTWMNVGSGKTLASGANQLLHTDGFWEDSGATITGAHMAMCRYEAILGDSDFGNLNIFQLNFTQTLDAIFDVNDPAKALGYVAGGAGGGAVGSIPIFTVGASAVKYIYIYDAA